MQEMQGTQFQSLGQEDPLEKEMETHSSILAWDDPLDRGAWWATVHGVTKSLTRLSIHECILLPGALLGAADIPWHVATSL